MTTYFVSNSGHRKKSGLVPEFAGLDTVGNVIPDRVPMIAARPLRTRHRVLGAAKAPENDSRAVAYSTISLPSIRTSSSTEA